MTQEQDKLLSDEVTSIYLEATFWFIYYTARSKQYKCVMLLFSPGKNSSSNKAQRSNLLTVPQIINVVIEVIDIWVHRTLTHILFLLQYASLKMFHNGREA